LSKRIRVIGERVGDRTNEAKDLISNAKRILFLGFGYAQENLEAFVSILAAIYRQRNPQDSDYYRCVEDCFETFVQVYGEHYSRQYGFCPIWRMLFTGIWTAATRTSF